MALEKLIFKPVTEYNLEFGVARHAGKQAQIVMVRPIDHRNLDIIMSVPNTRIVIIGGKPTEEFLRQMMKAHGKDWTNRKLTGARNNKPMFSSKTFTDIRRAIGISKVE